MAQFNGIAILITSSGRPVNIDWALSLPAFSYPMGMSYAMFLAKGQERGNQRDALLQKAIDVGAEYAFFLDDDTICPNYTIKQLHYELTKRPDVAVIGGIYCTKSPQPEPLVFEKLGGGPFYGWTLGQVFECKGIATGCMMIRTSLIKDIPKPWFVDFSEAPVGRTVEYNGIEFPQAKDEGTDDLFFCRKVNEAGHKILAHGGVLPVHVDDAGVFYTLPLDSYPCRTFDKEIAQAQAEGKRNLVITIDQSKFNTGETNGQADHRITKGASKE